MTRHRHTTTTTTTTTTGPSRPTRWLFALARALTAAVGLLLAALLAAGPAQAQLKSGEHPEASPVWLKIRPKLFGDKPILEATAAQLSLEAPARAEDAATVPIALHTHLPVGDTREVRKLYLVIDNNPSPVAAVFEMAPGNGPADIETRVRIDEYSHVRAIAELSDGSLLMALRFVKASGGCSAPPGKDPQAALVNMGKMRLRVDGELQPGRPALVQLMVSHPNHSGMAMDQSTRHYTPAHFVRELKVSYGGQPVLTAELDFAISENPNFRFQFVPRGDGVLKAEVVDSQDLRFETSLNLAPAR